MVPWALMPATVAPRRGARTLRHDVTGRRQGRPTGRRRGEGRGRGCRQLADQLHRYERVQLVGLCCTASRRRVGSCPRTRNGRGSPEPRPAVPAPPGPTLCRQAPLRPPPLPQCRAGPRGQRPRRGRTPRGSRACSAFPTGIPDARLDNERAHRQPDDGGVQFIAKPGDAFPAYAFPAYAFPVSGVPVERP